MSQSASVSATTCMAVLKPPRGAAGKSYQNQAAHAKRIQKIMLDQHVAVECRRTERRDCKRSEDCSPGTPSAGIPIDEELLLLFASYHVAESRCKGIEQHAGDNYKSPSLCDEAYPTREERTASNRSESSLEGNLAKTDYHKKERGTDDRTGDLV